MVFIFGLAGIGYALFMPGYRQLKIGLGSANWPTVPGILRLAEISSSTDSDDDTIYTFNVVYEYGVEGKNYQNSRLGVRPVTANTTEDLAEYLQNYSVGQEIEVRYNPNDPKESILVPGTRAWSWILVILGGLVWLFTLAMLGTAFKGK